MTDGFIFIDGQCKQYKTSNFNKNVKKKNFDHGGEKCKGEERLYIYNK